METYTYIHRCMTLYVITMDYGHSRAQGDDPGSVGSQLQEKQHLLPEELPERFFVTWRRSPRRIASTAYTLCVCYYYYCSYIYIYMLVPPQQKTKKTMLCIVL